VSTWREWHGGACPTDEKAEVRVRFASGHVGREAYKAGGLRWSRTGHPFDIAAYQVTSVEGVE
jgi:hypothetical protein